LIGINKSLTGLGHCINSLSKEQDYIPYRNCKLTRILKDTIQNGCRINMIINISPSKSSEFETHSTLQFAERLKKVKLESYAHKRSESADKHKGYSNFAKKGPIASLSPVNANNLSNDDEIQKLI